MKFYRGLIIAVILSCPIWLVILWLLREYIQSLKLMTWSAMSVIMPYAMYRKKYDWFAVLFLLFAMLSLDVMSMLHIKKINEAG